MNIWNWVEKPTHKIWIYSVGAILFMALAMATWLNKIHLAQSNITQNWLLLEKNIKLRDDLLPYVAQLLPPGAELRSALQQVYTDSRQFPYSEQIFSQEMLVKVFEAVQNQLSRVVYQAFTELESNQNIRANRDYQSVHSKYYTIESQIMFAKGALNKQIRYYNDNITVYPQKWINQIYPKYQIKYTCDFKTVIELSQPASAS